MAVFLLALGTACGGGDATLLQDAGRQSPALKPTTCNGREDLCARRLDQTVMVMTHNAMSTVEARFKAPNQNHGIARQLNAGVRGLMLDMHMFMGEPYLCHGDCKRGRTALSQGLQEIDAFMHANPDAVIVVLVEDYLAPDVLHAALTTSHLVSHLQEPPPEGAAWPTLGEMVARDTRLVLFSEHATDGPSWFPYAWKHVRDTPYKAYRVRDFSCARYRGPKKGAFFLVNHWLGPSHPKRAEVANRRAVLQTHVQGCVEALNRLPNFIGVDFYDIGDVWDVVGWVDDAWRAGL